MLISKDSLNLLKPEQEYYLITNNTVNRDIFIGKFGNYYLFANNNQLIKIYENNPKTNDNISRKLMYTTYKEACLRFRELQINLINHWNGHYLKDIPIKVVQPERVSEETPIKECKYFGNEEGKIHACNNAGGNCNRCAYFK